jgi:hypothetical protein
VITSCDIDYRSSSPYIWLHLNKGDEKNESQMRELLTDLDDYYDNEISSSLVPSLCSIIHNQLQKSQMFFAESICEYQEKHGKKRTQDTLHVYFKQIKPNQFYSLDDDDDFWE